MAASGINIQTFQSFENTNTPLKGNAGIIYLRDAAGVKTVATEITMRLTNEDGTAYYYSIDDVVETDEELGQINILQEGGNTGLLLVSYKVKPLWATDTETVFFPPQRIEFFLNGGENGYVDVGEPPRDSDGAIRWDALKATNVNKTPITTTLIGINYRWATYTDGNTTSIEITNGHDAYAEFTPFRPPQCNLGMDYHDFAPNVDQDTRIRVQIEGERENTNLFTGLIKELSWTDEITQRTPKTPALPIDTTLTRVGIWNRGNKYVVDIERQPGKLYIRSPKQLQYRSSDNENRIVPKLNVGQEYLLYTDTDITSHLPPPIGQGSVIEVVKISDSDSGAVISKIIDYTKVSGNTYDQPSDLSDEVALYEVTITAVDPPTQIGIWTPLIIPTGGTFVFTDNQGGSLFSANIPSLSTNSWGIFVSRGQSGTTIYWAAPDNDIINQIVRSGRRVTVQIDNGTIHTLTYSSVLRDVGPARDDPSRNIGPGRLDGLVFTGTPFGGAALSWLSGSRLTITLLPTIPSLSGRLVIKSATQLEYSVTDNESNTIPGLKVNTEYFIFAASSINSDTVPNLNNGSRIRVTSVSDSGSGSSAVKVVDYTVVSGATYTSSNDLSGEVAIYELSGQPPVTSLRQVGIWDSTDQSITPGNLLIKSATQFEYTVEDNEEDTTPNLNLGSEYIIYTADDINTSTVPSISDGSRIRVTGIADNLTRTVTNKAVDYNWVQGQYYRESTDLEAEVSIYEILLDNLPINVPSSIKQIGIWNTSTAVFSYDDRKDTDNPLWFRTADEGDWEIIRISATLPFYTVIRVYGISLGNLLNPGDEIEIRIDNERPYNQTVFRAEVDDLWSTSIIWIEGNFLGLANGQTVNEGTTLTIQLVAAITDDINPGQFIIRSDNQFEYAVRDNKPSLAATLKIGTEYIIYTANSIDATTPATHTTGSRIRVINVGTAGSGANISRLITYVRIAGEIYDEPRDLHNEVALYEVSYSRIPSRVTFEQIGIWGTNNTRLDGLDTGTLEIKSPTQFEYATTDNEGETVTDLEVGKFYVIHTAGTINPPTDPVIAEGMTFRVTSVADDTDPVTVNFDRTAGEIYDEQSDLLKEAAIYEITRTSHPDRVVIIPQPDIVTRTPQPPVISLGTQVGIWNKYVANVPATDYVFASWVRTTNAGAGQDFGAGDDLPLHGYWFFGNWGTFNGRVGRTTTSQLTLYLRGHAMANNLLVGQRVTLTTRRRTSQSDPTLIVVSTVTYTIESIELTQTRSARFTPAPSNPVPLTRIRFRSPSVLSGGGDLGSHLTITVPPFTRDALNPGALDIIDATQFEYSVTDGDGNTVDGLTVGNQYLIYTDDDITSATTPDAATEGSIIQVTKVDDTGSGDSTAKQITYTRLHGAVYGTDSSVDNEIAIYNVTYTPQPDIVTRTPQPDIVTNIPVPDTLSVDNPLGIWDTDVRRDLVVSTGDLVIRDYEQLEYSETDNESNVIPTLKTDTEYIIYSASNITTDTPVHRFDGARIFVNSVANRGRGTEARKIVDYTWISGNVFIEQSDLNREVAIFEVASPTINLPEVSPTATIVQPLYRASLGCYGNSIVAQDLNINSTVGTVTELLTEIIDLLNQHGITLVNRLRNVNYFWFWKDTSAGVFQVLSNIASNNHNYPARVTEDGNGLMELVDTNPNEVPGLTKSILPGTSGNEQFRSSLAGVKYNQYKLIEVDGQREIIATAFDFDVKTGGSPPNQGNAPDRGQERFYNGAVRTSPQDYDRNNPATWRPINNWFWDTTAKKWYWIGPIVTPEGYEYSFSVPDNRVLGSDPYSLAKPGTDVLAFDSRILHANMNNDMTVTGSRTNVSGVLRQKYPYYTGTTSGNHPNIRILPLRQLVYENKRANDDQPDDFKVEVKFPVTMRAYEVEDLVWPVAQTAGSNLLDLQNHPGLRSVHANDIAKTTFARERHSRYWEVRVTNLSNEEVILITNFSRFSYRYYGTPASGVIIKYTITRTKDKPFWDAKLTLVNNTFKDPVINTFSELRISAEGRLRISPSGLLSLDKE